MYFEMKFSYHSQVRGSGGSSAESKELAHGKEVLLDIQKITSDQ